MSHSNPPLGTELQSILSSILQTCERNAEQTAANGVILARIENWAEETNERLSSLEVQVIELNRRTSNVETAVIELNRRTSNVETTVIELNRRTSHIETTCANIQADITVKFKAIEKNSAVRVKNS